MTELEHYVSDIESNAIEPILEDEDKALIDCGDICLQRSDSITSMSTGNPEELEEGTTSPYPSNEYDLFPPMFNNNEYETPVSVKQYENLQKADEQGNLDIRKNIVNDINDIIKYINFINIPRALQRN